MNMANQILPVSFSNPLAQAWRLPSFEAPNVLLRWEYAEKFTVPASSTIFNQGIWIQPNSDFLARELAFDRQGANPGTIAIRFRDGSGRKLSRDLLQVEELEGPIILDNRFDKGKQIFVDIQNSGVVDIVVQPILKGVEEFQRLGINTCMPGFDPEYYIPLYKRYSVPPPGWHDEPVDMYYELAVTASGSKRSTPLQMDGDADFYWRGITGYSNEADGIGLLKLLFYDAWQNQLASAQVQQGNEFGVAPNARPVYPEVCCPAYSTLTADATEYTGNATTARFALRGVKRFKD